jgi:hypothetical protein
MVEEVIVTPGFVVGSDLAPLTDLIVEFSELFRKCYYYADVYA